MPDLLERYGCGPIRFSGDTDALYERHLLFDDVIAPTAAGPREQFEAAARSAASLVRINIAAGAPDTGLSPRAAHATSQARAAVRELKLLSDATSMSPR